mmetsp:Transcript_37290/g.92819  ORF Transcript_37290/g.92819 Transcript_37290/m.92819 type:complete len:95 (-) Transcript_37290:35-319(-)
MGSRAWLVQIDEKLDSSIGRGMPGPIVGNVRDRGGNVDVGARSEPLQGTRSRADLEAGSGRGESVCSIEREWLAHREQWSRYGPLGRPRCSNAR